MEEKQYTSLTVPSTDYLQQWYQNSHQTEGVLQYHNQDPYSAEGAFGAEQHLTELEPALQHHDFPSPHQSYASSSSSSAPPHQHHPHHPHHHTLDYHTYEEDQHHHPHYGPTAGHQQQQSPYGQPPPPPVERFQQSPYGQPPPPAELSQAVTPGKKKRGRPPKRKAGEEGCEEERSAQDEEQEQAAAARKAKRTLNRFNGMSVDEVMAKTLPDIITYNLDILIIGINPGLMSAFKGRHYPNPGNHFWKCLFLAGFTEQQLNFMHDQSLPEKYGIGFTNMVERTTPGSKDLSSKEIREGGRQLLQKLQKYKPLIAAFNGKGIYEIFCKEIFGVKATNLEFGLQPYKIPETETLCYLMPSSSPRCAQFPRAQDKVHFYIKLKELRDKVKDLSPSRDVEETKYSFDLQLAKEDAKRMAIKEEKVDPEYEGYGGAHPDERQTTDYCNMPSNKHTGTDSKEQVAGHMTYDQWMSQIPDINCNSNIITPVLLHPGTQTL